MHYKFSKDNSCKTKPNLVSGFTLVELLIGISVFSVIIISVYNAYSSIFDAVSVSRAKITAVDLVNEQLEIIRNMPYAQVGIVGGIPSGVLLHNQTIIRNSISFSVITTIRNIDDPFDGTLGGTPNDTSPADYKLVEIELSCELCKNFSPIIVTTRVSPKNLETASTNGALFVRVFDANGQPIPDASVHIENNLLTPSIIIDDLTNTQGMLQIVDVPPSVNSYEITVTKNGYSTDKTYLPSVSNPNPTKPHSTVALQQVTQVSFFIDRLSSFSVSSLSPNCNPVPNIDFSITGSKNIGTNPIVLKYNENKITNSGGLLNISNMEWDTYSFFNIDPLYDLVGTNPLSLISLLPNSNQTVQLVMSPKNPRTLLITVKDGTTNLPLSGVSVSLSKTDFDSTKITGQGFLGQTDWSGGGGQATSTDPLKYFSSDGNMDINNPSGDLKLKSYFGEYVSSGELVSSAFDTMTQSNFQQIEWNPIDQPLNSNVRFQIATNNDGFTWNFLGPDGTSGTYYTVENKNINSINDNKRYFRYKLFLNTTSTSTTPNISDVYFTFTTSCTPPGQVSFQGLDNSIYNIDISKAGFVSQNTQVSVTSDWQYLEIIMVPN